jgi:FMN phosphatase YigB (HAD superfamily)
MSRSLRAILFDLDGTLGYVKKPVTAEEFCTYLQSGGYNVYPQIWCEKEILGPSERRVLEAYLKGERLKGYNTLLWRIHTIGLKAIISGCEHDLAMLRRLLRFEEQKIRPPG